MGSSSVAIPESLRELVAGVPKPVVVGGAAVLGAVVLNKLYKTLTTSKWPVDGKVAVITGGSSGIGKAIALQLSEMGASVVLAARREQELKEVAAECDARRARLHPKSEARSVWVVADVSKQEDCKKIIAAAVQEFQRIDLLVLNAGISMSDCFEDIKDVTVLTQLMEINFFHCLYTTHAALSQLISSQGRIVAISSLAGKFGVPGRSGYSASKFAMQGFFDALRNEIEPKHGVKVTVVSPGPVKTDINRTRVGAAPGLAATSELDTAQGITAEKAASIIIDAVQRGERESVFLPCPVFWQTLGLWFPGFADYLLRLQMAKLMKNKAT